MNYLFALLPLLIALISCSSSSVAGNSSETGNCKIIGIATYANGSAASDIPVVLTEQIYKAFDTIGYVDTVFTDSLGTYQFDNINPGEWVVSATKDQKGFISQNIQLAAGDTHNVNNSLAETGTIKLNHSESLSASIYFSVLGTPFTSTTIEATSKTYLSEVPSGDQVIVSVDDIKGNNLFRDTVLVTAGDTVSLYYGFTAAIIHGTEEQNIANSYASEFHLKRVETVHISADTLTTAHLAAIDLLFFTGTAQIHDTLNEYFTRSTTPIINTVPNLLETLQLVDISTSSAGWGEAAEVRFNTNVAFDHPIMDDVSRSTAAGISIEVTEQSKMCWGRPLPSAARIGEMPAGDGNQYFLFSYETGDQLSQVIAQSRRVGLFANGSPLTLDGRRIIQGAVLWSLGLR